MSGSQHWLILVRSHSFQQKQSFTLTCLDNSLRVDYLT